MKRFLAFLIALMMFCVPAFADETELIVSGSGTVSVEADRVSASLGFMLTGEDLAALQKQANETMAAVCDALKQAGLDEKSIATNYIYVSPRYDYSGEIEKLIGYNINNSLSIHTDEMDQIGAYIDAAFAAGANTFDSISFSVADSSAANAQALEIAVQDARSKAEVIANATGRELGGILEIREVSQNSYAYNGAADNVRYAVAESAAMGAGTTVRAAQVQVSANVEIIYELK